MFKPTEMYQFSGFNHLTETFELMKNLWPSMNTPALHMASMMMPKFSVEEIDKQIKDFKAVEVWLSLNLNMLQGTIKALEMQSEVLSKLHSAKNS